MELDKKCIGNDFSLFLYVYRLNDKAVVTEGEILENGVPEDLTNAKNLVLKLYRLKDGRSTILDPVITGNELKANINADIQRLDVYGVVLNYDKDNAAFKDGLQHFKTDIKVFEIVQTMDEVTSCDITVIGLVRAGTDGMSAFDIWKTEQNNNDLTVTDYLAYLQKPATDAVAAGELTLEQYVLAAQSAQLASEQAKSAAQSFAQGAYNSAGVAVASEANALDYKNAAALSETKTKISEDNAKLSETRAGTSEVNSKASETNADGSELNAATSELNAKASEEATLLSEQNAKISEDNSKTSETNSKDSENKAKTSETNAKTSETNSKTSETNAQSSEAKAKTSETNAKTSETAADASAQQAAATLSSKANQTDLVQLSSDLNAYNVTHKNPLSFGSYYTAVTSRTAVPVANRKGGLILIYQDQTDGWMAHQFMGTNEQAVVVSSWTQAALWQFIGTGKTLTDMQKTIAQLSSLFKTTDNLYNNALNVTGYIINDSGAIVATNGEMSYQSVTANTEYVIRGLGNFTPGSIGCLGYCDSTKTIIGTVDMTTLESYKNGKVFTTPANTAFILFNVFVLNQNFRQTVELYKGKDIVPDIYTAPITLSGLVQLDKDLSNFKTEQAAINEDLYSIVSIDSMDTSGVAELGSVLGTISGGDNPTYYWNQWTPLEYDAALTKVNLNPLRIASVTGWRTGLKFGIAIAKLVEGTSTGQLECVSITTFDYVQGATEIDLTDLNIRVPAGYYALFSSVYLGTNASASNVPSYGYQTTPGGTTAYFSSASVGAKSSTFAGGILQYDQMLTYNIQETLVTKVSDNDRRITALENEEPDEKSNEVSIDTVTDVMFMGSSLTSSHYQPKSTSWIERLNDMVDVVVVNNGVSGYNLGANMGQLVNNTALDKDSVNTPKNLNPKYIWWNNSANGTPAGLTGITQLMNAMEITASYGAKMLLGSEEDYSNIAKSLEDTYRAFSAEHGVPYSPMIQVWRKCYPSSIPYKGWITAGHSGYRAIAPYNMHKELLQAIPIDKSVKMFKVRPTYKTGSPVIGDLSYDTIEQRLKFFTAISAGAADSTATNAIDTLDDHTYDVPGGNNIGTSVSETSLMKRSAAITFNKFALVEFILDNVNITKGNFEIACSVQPTKVYVAMTKNSSTSYTDVPRTQFVEVTFTYNAGKINATIVRTDYDIQLFDKVRFIIEYSGAFTLINPRFYQYDGREKAKKPDVLTGYSYRKYGTELNSNTAFPMTGHGWTLANTAAVKALPTEIANYTSYNNEKSHLQLNADTDTATKSIAITQPVNKVAVRVIVCIWPKLATTKFIGTAIENSEYIDATVPHVTTYDYDYGTLQLRINTNIVRKQVVLQCWHELYFEIDVNPIDTALDIEIGRNCFIDSSYSNSNKPVFIHDISIQKIS